MNPFVPSGECTFPWTTGDVILTWQPTVVASGRHVHSLYANGVCIHDGRTDVITKGVVEPKSHLPWTFTLCWLNYYEYGWLLNNTLLFGIRFI